MNITKMICRFQILVITNRKNKKNKIANYLISNELNIVLTI